MCKDLAVLKKDAAFDFQLITHCKGIGFAKSFPPNPNNSQHKLNDGGLLISGSGDPQHPYLEETTPVVLIRSEESGGPLSSITSSVTGWITVDRSCGDADIGSHV